MSKTSTKKSTALRITPESILVGDTIRVTTKKGDVTISAVGTVARREYGRHYVEYLTQEDVTLLEVYSFDENPARITLLNRLSWNNPGLFIINTEDD